LSFQDFLNRLERMGVDIESFDKWGSSQQFNWYPPIDIDKIINYQNYYWDGTDRPQYITIKNQKNKIAATYVEIKNHYLKGWKHTPLPLYRNYKIILILN
jgi:hypothetical protein